MCAASLALLAAAPQSGPPGTSSLYLSVPGITPVGAFPSGAIAVLSYDIGATRVQNIGLAKPSTLVITKRLDSTTPKFLEYFTTGKTIAGDSTLYFVASVKGEQKIIETFQVRDVQVVEDKPAGDSAGASERIGLSFETIKFCNDRTCASWNFRTNSPATRKR